MKIREIIEEGKLRSDSHYALPNVRVHPNLDNGNPYHAYRFGVALAGAPDSEFNKDGPIGQKMTTIGYTAADDEIVKKAEQEMGAPSKQITTKKSQELPGANTKSPIAKKKKNKYGV